MPRPLKHPRPQENLDWAVAFRQWLEGSGLTPDEAAGRLDVAKRTLDRWRSGEAIPDASKRPLLKALGAPVPTKAKKGPRAHERTEAQLKDIRETLARLEKKIDSLFPGD